MGKVNHKGMAAVKKERELRVESLDKLTLTPFDLANSDQQLALKKYIDAFELSANQLYLYQAMGTGIKTWIGSWAVGRLLPIPDFVNYFLTAVLYFGVAGYMLERFSMTDFYEQLEEMKALYNWCLKNRHEICPASIDNTQKLYSPEIQRLIKLLAPLCDPEFMIAWPKEVVKTEENGGWSKTLTAGYSALTATLSMFSRSAPQPTMDQHRLKELKISVETGGLNLGVFSGFEQAVRYFATSTDFRGMLASKIQRPLEMVKQVVPAAIMESITHPKQP